MASCQEDEQVGLITSIAQLKKELEAANNTLVLVDFYAEWCGPCRMIAPKVQKLSEKYNQKLIVLKADMDNCDENFAEELDITCMPTFHFYKDKKKIDQFSGANVVKLEQLVEKYTSE